MVMVGKERTQLDIPRLLLAWSWEGLKHWEIGNVGGFPPWQHPLDSPLPPTREFSESCRDALGNILLLLVFPGKQRKKREESH